ncbi:hypothetical protein [Pelagibius marinus]|uniref:hypothetical protein n=1 Tax=Pelagibius marinus TaxID=2762760 RepID=UPI001873209F|nr:hypothetical protein [Pelagibius marinus]
MSPRNLAFVGCRLLAIYVLLSVIQAQTSNLFFYLQSLNISESWGLVRTNEFEFDPFFQSALLNLVIALILWFRAGWFAAKVARGTPEPQEEKPATWSPQNALSVVVVATGLWVLILLVPSLTSVLQDLIQSGRVVSTSLISLVLMVGLGAVCIFSPRGIAGAITRLRGW